MIRQILILFGTLFICLHSFSTPLEGEKKIVMKGDNTFIPFNSVRVTIGRDNTLTTAFNKDIDNVTITVKKQSGEIVFIENIDAKEWDICPTTIPDYKEGEYKIEISTPEGRLEGNF